MLTDTPIIAARSRWDSRRFRRAMLMLRPSVLIAIVALGVSFWSVI
ncbi:MAG: hypothetical protein OXC02_01695 [Rhodobacteraceae bacterium]|nr:hypothetical protein [Paracoccaceae bacterium]